MILSYTKPYFLLCQPLKFIFYNFSTHLASIAHNVPAVYDVWAGIKGLCEAKTARPNVPE
jgi:hypothetical protein